MSDVSAFEGTGSELLVETVQKLSLARTVPQVVEIVKHAARKLTGADGATFILRDGELCHYVDEDAVGPLWKGRRFPMKACISGWAMIHRQSVLIEDIFQDPRIPIDAYKPTFVKSLLMVPIRSQAPIGAIGNYWSRCHSATAREIRLLQALADSTSIALENINHLDEILRQLELRDEFISICAHELKTPLTPLALQVDLLSRMIRAGSFSGHEREASLRVSVDTAARQVINFVRLTDNLLEFSRIRLGQFRLNPESSLELGEPVLRLAEEFRNAYHCRIECDVQPGIQGRWDRARLELVIRNLLANAVRHCEGTPIRVSLKSSAGRARLRVADLGRGIAREDQERIFGRYERAVSMREYGGIGLGLYLSREIVKAHGGEIEVESAPGNGATFAVELPDSSAIIG